jgi:6-pyruvoyltetrahydropterin/6-carboxytetrahydropterin synthase
MLPARLARFKRLPIVAPNWFDQANGNGYADRMYTVRVKDDFAAAHFLARYHGKCEKLHGHNYRVFVTAAGTKLDDGGMLLDFGIMKEALRAVIKEVDHTSLNDHPAFADGCPSAERIAQFIYDRMHTALPQARFTLVEVFETDRNRATYSPD